MPLVDAGASHRIQGIGMSLMGEPSSHSSQFNRLIHQPLIALLTANQLERVGRNGFAFSTLVITYEQPNQWASARSVVDQRAGWSGCEW